MKSFDDAMETMINETAKQRSRGVPMRYAPSFFLLCRTTSNGLDGLKNYERDLKPWQTDAASSYTSTNFGIDAER